MQFWTCCKKNYVPGIPACRKCGKLKPEIGILDNPPKTPKVKKERKSKDPHISDDENEFAVSTMKGDGE